MSVYSTINLITKYIYTTFNKDIYVDTISHIIRLKFKNKFKICPGLTLEDKRFQVSINDIENNLNA